VEPGNMDKPALGMVLLPFFYTPSKSYTNKM